MEQLQADKAQGMISAIAETMPQLAEAKAMLVTGQTAQASYQLEQGVERHPNHCDLWHAYGHTMRNQGKTAEALEAYSKAIDLAYRYHSLIHFECSAQFLQRAKLHLFMGEQDKAQIDLDAAIFQDHNNQPALDLKQNGWQRGQEVAEYSSNLMTEVDWRHQTARAHFNMESLMPHQLQHDKAIFFMRHNNMRTSFVIISELLKSRPDYSLGWHHRALMHLHIEETRQAYDDINKAIETAEAWHERYHRDAALHHYHRGLLQLELNEPEMAVMDLSKAIELDKHFTPAMIKRAEIRAGLGQFPTALADIESALAIDTRPEWLKAREELMKSMGM